MYCIPIRVECYSGSRAEEIPRALYWEEQRFEVAEILDRWYQGSGDPTVPAADYFKVRGVNGKIYVIKYDRGSHCWYLVSQPELL